jgi:hypothetical protein
MAKNYIDNLSEETRKSMLEKAEEGIWPSFAPLGYRNIEGPNGKRVIAPDPQMAPIIIRLFEWYATGNYSLREVTKMAQAAGIVFRGERESGADGNGSCHLTELHLHGGLQLEGEAVSRNPCPADHP